MLMVLDLLGSDAKGVLLIPVLSFKFSTCLQELGSDALEV